MEDFTQTLIQNNNALIKAYVSSNPIVIRATALSVQTIQDNYDFIEELTDDGALEDYVRKAIIDNSELINDLLRAMGREPCYEIFEIGTLGSCLWDTSSEMLL